MQFEIQQYASGWELCHRIQAPLCTRYSLNMPLSLPSCRWERLTMHFIPDLPASMGSRYTGMSVIIDCLTDVVTYIPCKRTLTLQSWHICCSNRRSANVVYQPVSPPVAANSTVVMCATEFAPTWVSITDSQPLSTFRWTLKLRGTTERWISTLEHFATTSRTTGSHCYHWWILHITSPSTNPRWWHPSGWTATTIQRCNWSRP